MKKINLVLIKKRGLLFLLIGLATLMMNVFLWNETTQLIRSIPDLVNLKNKSSKTVYEINYLPNSDPTGLIKENSQSEKDLFYQLIVNNFFSEEKEQYLYENKQEYLDHPNLKTAGSLLNPLTKEVFGEKFRKSYTTVLFNDLLVFNKEKSELEKIEKAAKNLHFSISFLSLKDRFTEEFNYYFSNFIFGLVVSCLLLSFGIFLIYCLISSCLKIFKQEIRLLRVIGLSTNKITKNFIFLLNLPLLIGLVFFFLFASSLGVGFIAADFVYLFFVNIGLVLFSIALIKHKVRRMLDA